MSHLPSLAVDDLRAEVTAALASDGAWSGEVTARRGDGAEVPLLAQLLAHRDAEGRTEFLSAVLRGISERKQFETTLHHQATHDPLTGLPNRLLLRDRFDVAAANARRNHTGLGLLLVDLDEFKQVNDTFGHEAGDHLLTAVGEKLRGCVRESDTVARLGGDEFVVLLGNLGAPEAESAVVAEKILERLSASTLIAGHAIVVTPSIGVAVYPRDGEDLAACLRCADRAMYEAKQHGGRSVRFSARERAEQYRLGLQ
jgi:diguanylate cyclase (GGDEF)-like protein